MSSPAERGPQDAPPPPKKKPKLHFREQRRRIRSGTAAVITQTRYRR